MTLKNRARTLIYKRTHDGDPDSKTGVFGNNDCMGQVRGWSFDAVIGIGGKGRESQKNCIARKLTWVGIGPHKSSGQRGPIVTFDHFLHYGELGPLLEKLAPKLARHIFGGNVRVIMGDSLPDDEHLEVEKILNLAMKKPSSGQLAGVSPRDSQETGCNRRSKSCHRKSVTRKAK